MNTKYKMIVLDLDGTLTNSKKEITPRTKAALMAAQRQGVKVVLASGRPTYGIAPLAKELKLAEYNGFILSYNGAKIINCTTQETIFEQTLNPAFVPVLYHTAMENSMQILTYQGEGIAATSETDKYVQEEAFINKLPIEQYDDFLNQLVYPINKCLIVGDPVPLHEVELKLSEKVKGRMNVYRSADYFLECVPLNVDKAQSLQKLLETTGLTANEIIACGDGYNDLSMIRFAGLGVAMANANEDIREQADYVTLSNEEDGIGYVVEKFLLN